MSMGEPEVTGSGAEDGSEYDDEMMSTPVKVHVVDWDHTCAGVIG